MPRNGRVSLEIPRELRDRLATLARIEDRTMVATISRLVDQALREQETKL